jgi:phage-related protein
MKQQIYRTLALGVVLIVPVTGWAQRNPNPDINRTELRNFDTFLDSHPQIRRELTKNPSLVNNPKYLKDHPELDAFLKSHGGVREELRENPSIFMHRELGYEKAENRGLKGPEAQPHMQAALQHLREAERELNAAIEDKGGYRVKALQSVKQAESDVQQGIQYANVH